VVLNIFLQVLLFNTIVGIENVLKLHPSLLKLKKERGGMNVRH
jgi:hypothetical protein